MKPSWGKGFLDEIAWADAILLGAGAGLSTAAGYRYDGSDFEKNFADFIAKYHFNNMYEGGFFDFPTSEEKWAYWSRYIYLNRYRPAPKPLYEKLLSLLGQKAFFVLTTNVDHTFQRAGFPKDRLFYTQGDFGLFQCPTPCHKKTYDNEEIIRRMFHEQKGMQIPSGLIPHCPDCGKELVPNLRNDETFVEDEGWDAHYALYSDWLEKHRTGKVLYLELGVGMNTPAIIKYAFWSYMRDNPMAHYVYLNLDEGYAPQSVASRSLLISDDLGKLLDL